MTAFAISDLRKRPQHAEAVARRIWSAFWKQHGTPFAGIRNGIVTLLQKETGIPFVLVAEIDGKVCGNCLVVENDEEARPELRPWLAAVWVDEEVRKQGIATALLEEGVRRCRALGIERLYLVSRPALRGFYTKLGWRVFEENVGRHGQTLYVREPGAVPSHP